MDWILGGSTALGVAGVVALALYMAKMATYSRADLLRLLQSARDLSDARRDIDGYKRAVEEKDAAIDNLKKQVEQERAANKEALAALLDARAKLADAGDAASVASSINGAFARLSEMSEVSGTETGTTEDDHNP